MINLEDLKVGSLVRIDIKEIQKRSFMMPYILLVRKVIRNSENNMPYVSKIEKDDIMIRSWVSDLLGDVRVPKSSIISYINKEEIQKENKQMSKRDLIKTINSILGEDVDSSDNLVDVASNIPNGTNTDTDFSNTSDSNNDDNIESLDDYEGSEGPEKTENSESEIESLSSFISKLEDKLNREDIEDIKNYVTSKLEGEKEEEPEEDKDETESTDKDETEDEEIEVPDEKEESEETKNESFLNDKQKSLAQKYKRRFN